jgi:hypothetical protein
MAFELGMCQLRLLHMRHVQQETLKSLNTCRFIVSYPCMGARRDGARMM